MTVPGTINDELAPGTLNSVLICGGPCNSTWMVLGTGTDISHVDMRPMEGGMHGEFVVEVRDPAHLDT